MNLVTRLEQRLALPGDAETDRSRRALGTAILLASSIALLSPALSFFSNGLTASGWQYVLFALFALLAGLLVLAIPRAYAPVVKTFLVVCILFNVLAQFTFGGYSSGLYAMPWAVLGPLGAVLLFGTGFTLVSLLTFALSLGLIAILEPAAAANRPEISAALMISTNTASLAILCLVITLASLYLLRQEERYRGRANDLLRNILPGPIAERLKESPGTIADGYNEATVLFADIVDFTTIASDADPVEVVNLLNAVFSEFDQLAEKHGLEKIKTIGDAYMVAAGLPERRPDHVEAIVAFALAMREAVGKHKGFHGEPVRLRIGINTGPVVAGVIGRQRFIYDLWGDAVNVASRMESNGLPNEIQVTAGVKEALQGRYTFIEREPVPIKGKGMMVTYLLQEGLADSGRKALSIER